MESEARFRAGPGIRSERLNHLVHLNCNLPFGFPQHEETCASQADKQKTPFELDGERDETLTD